MEDEYQSYSWLPSSTEANNANPLADLLKALQGGGLFGLGSAATGGLLGLGTSLLGGIAGLLGGETEEQKRAKQVFAMAKNRLGQNPLNPDQYMADYMRASQARNSAVGTRLDKQFGLDSGVGASEQAFRMESPLAEFMLNAKMSNDQLKSQNDNMLLQLMSSLSR